MSDLHELIKTTRESRELKRALAVTSTLAGRPWKEVAEELGGCESFIGKWRHIYDNQGLEGLKLGYKGSSGYLTPEAKADVMAWLQTSEHWNLGSLRAYLHRQYGVEYRSRQSYYALLHEAKLSWKKSQKRHPKADPEQVKATREAIQKKRRRRRERFSTRKPWCCLWMNVICCGGTREAMSGGLGGNGSTSRSSTNGNGNPIMGRSIFGRGVLWRCLLRQAMGNTPCCFSRRYGAISRDAASWSFGIEPPITGGSS